jgi:hypothetical protein
MKRKYILTLHAITMFELIDAKDELIDEEHIRYVYIEKEHCKKSSCIRQSNVIRADLGTANLHYNS